MGELFEDIKNYLDITWELNTAEQIKLRGMINRGKAFLSGKIGDCDFENDTPEKALLMDYCMYARAGQIPEFIENYKSEIVALQMNRWRKNAENKR